jgi:hypothetical protein
LSKSRVPTFRPDRRGQAALVDGESEITVSRSDARPLDHSDPSPSLSLAEEEAIRFGDKYQRKGNKILAHSGPGQASLIVT